MIQSTSAASSRLDFDVRRDVGDTKCHKLSSKQYSAPIMPVNTAFHSQVTLSIEESHALIADDMARVDQFIRARLSSEVALVNKLADYIISSGGKRIRPQLAVLAAGAAGYVGEHHITLAAIIEFIHTATLLHDDVVDASELRRGNETANAVWGNEAAVLVGDFLYSRAFEMMVEVESLRVMDILARTTNRIAEGEVMQLLNVNEPDISEQQYLEVIEAKTARLFRATTQLGAVLAEETEENCLALAEYGGKLGTAFQIVDDVLDYASNSDAMGKNTGDDLAEGKTTLPLIFAMQSGTPQQRELIRHAIKTGGLDNLDEVLDAIQSTDSLQRSLDAARRVSQSAVDALAPLPQSDYKDALIVIALQSTQREL